MLLPTAVEGADGYETSEFYRAVGDITVAWNNRTGPFLNREGLFVTNADTAWTASGVIVAVSGVSGSSGQLTLTQVRGTWSNGDTVAIPGQTSTNFINKI